MNHKISNTNEFSSSKRIFRGVVWGLGWSLIILALVFLLLPIFNFTLIILAGCTILICIGVGVFLNLNAVHKPCPNCGTPFTAMPSGSRCPNCGHRVKAQNQQIISIIEQ